VVQHMPFTKEMGAQMGFPKDLNYENSTMHAELDIDGAKIMLSDNPMNKKGSGNVQVYVNFNSKEDLDKLYEKVKKKKFPLLIPYEKTF
jgi:uncharacterized glyoxalase superfamily protein PhnB